MDLQTAKYKFLCLYLNNVALSRKHIQLIVVLTKCALSNLLLHNKIRFLLTVSILLSPASDNNLIKPDSKAMTLSSSAGASVTCKYRIWLSVIISNVPFYYYCLLPLYVNVRQPTRIKRNKNLNQEQN